LLYYFNSSNSPALGPRPISGYDLIARSTTRTGAARIVHDT